MELDGILSLNEDELLLRLDELLYGDEAMAGTGKYERMLRSRKWLERFVDRNRTSLCAPLQRASEWRDSTDRLIEMATVIDTMVNIGLHRPSATVAAAILMKWGLQKICFGNGGGAAG